MEEIIEAAKNHVQKNSVKLEQREGQDRKAFILSLRRRCVDGRHTAEEAENSFAFAGADVGIAMALATASKGKLSPVESYKAVSRALKRLGSKFYYHTDHHADPVDGHHHEGKVACIGCGHAAKATGELSSEYGVDADEQLKMVQLIKSGLKDEDMAELEMVNLNGEHEEKAVLVIDGTNMTVLPMDSDTKEQYFVYDAGLINEYKEIIWEELLKDPKVEHISKEDFSKAEGDQRDITVRELATKQNKPTLAFKQNGDQLEYQPAA